MITNQQAKCKLHDDRGVSILIIAVSMIFVLGMAGLGIDLASLYVARSEAQRAADAAALAGAKALASNCTAGPGGLISPDCQARAVEYAEAVGNQNLIVGVSPKIGNQPGDITFLSRSTNDPQIQVIAARDTAHNNPMPTFFVKIFGINTANVSAKAVAEAYNPTAGPASTGAKCLKPWLMPNCDWGHSYQDYKQYQIPPDNPNCQGYVQFTQATAANYNTPASSEPVLPQSDTLGELLTIKSSDPSKASGPSKFYPVFLPVDNKNDPPSCPSCALTPGGGGPASGALYSENISCCNQNQIVCGTQKIQPITGNMVGPTANGVDCLIHQRGSSGQDTILFDPSTTSWTITGGANNPYKMANQQVASSDSVVTIPLYDGTPLCPGNSCPSQVNVVVTGFLQLFIKGESSGNVEAYVLNVIGCPNSADTGSSTGGGTNGSGPAILTGSPIAIRLIHP